MKNIQYERPLSSILVGTFSANQRYIPRELPEFEYLPLLFELERIHTGRPIELQLSEFFFDSIPEPQTSRRFIQQKTDFLTLSQLYAQWCEKSQLGKPILEGYFVQSVKINAERKKELEHLLQSSSRYHLISCGMTDEQSLRNLYGKWYEPLKQTIGKPVFP